MKNQTKEKLKRKLYAIIDQKGGDIETYKDIIKTIREYLRYIFGFMTCNLVMEKALRFTHEKFPDFNIILTSDGFDFNDLENSDENIEAFKFYIDNLIDITEKLAGDVLLKGLMSRLDNKKNIL